MNSIDKCIQALGNNIEILTKQKADKVFSVLTCMFPITKWGKIDWNTIEQKTTIASAQEVLGQLDLLRGDMSTSVFILWNEASLPVIKVDLKKIIEVMDEVLHVYFETLLFSPISRYVIEFYHEGEITAGITSSNMEAALKDLYGGFIKMRLDAKAFSVEYHGIINEIIVTGEDIANIAKKILNNHKLSDEENSILFREYLTNSAWRVNQVNPYPLVKLPAVLEFARWIKEVQGCCKAVMLYREVLEF